MRDYSRFEFLQVEVKDRVAVLTLNRPDVLNAIHPPMHEELDDIFVDFSLDNDVNAIVITGAGRAFCAGGDIRGMRQRISEEPPRRSSIRSGSRLINNMLEVGQPIIAAVNGDAVGLGATIALFCDVTIASENARIGDPHVKVGYVAGDGGAVVWPLLIGVNRAKELLMTGDLISARDAEKMGLVNHVVPQGEALPRALELAQRLANGPSLAISGTKISVNKWLKHQVNLVLDASLALERITGFSEDHKEAVQAFIGGRPAQFKGR